MSGKVSTRNRPNADQISEVAGIITHRVHVPALQGVSVQAGRESVRQAGIAPDSPHGRFAGMLEQPRPDWECVVTFEIGPRGAVPVGVELKSTNGQPVTRARWDAVKVADLIREAAATVAWMGPPVLRAGQSQAFETRPQHRGRGKGRPSIYSDAHYRRVGEIYSDAEVEGLRPVRAVAAGFVREFPGLTNPRDRRARAWVRAARVRGYIAPSSKGGDQ